MDNKVIPISCVAKWAVLNCRGNVPLARRHIKGVLLGNKIVDGWQGDLNALKQRTLCIVNHILPMSTNRFGGGAYCKIRFDLLFWSHTALSRLLLKMSADNTSFTYSVCLLQRPHVMRSIQEALDYLVLKCNRQKLTRFDESNYPSRGCWNDVKSTKHIENCLSEVFSNMDNCVGSIAEMGCTASSNITNTIYINVQPPTKFQSFRKCPCKIGKSVYGGQSRLTDAHSGRFRPLADIRVRLGTSFKSRTAAMTGVSYKHIGDDLLFERFVHHTMDAANHRHQIRSWHFTHREMFDFSPDEIRDLVRKLVDDQKKYDYTLLGITSKEADWSPDHPQWTPLNLNLVFDIDKS